MNDFALVTEGPTDHAILKNILLGYFKNQREPAINREHPDPQAAAASGGWTLLLQYLRDKKFRQAFQFNHYLIIQVDTDKSEDTGFDVPHQDENGPLRVPVLIERVIERLQREIGESDWATYAGRFIFAIAVHQIECWALPLWFSDAHAGKTTGCIAALGRCQNLRDKLKEKRFRWIRPEEKDFYSYDEASRGYRKTRLLHDQGRQNPSLAVFLDDLDRRGLKLPAQE
jgi:hypothetical protein